LKKLQRAALFGFEFLGRIDPAEPTSRDAAGVTTRTLRMKRNLGLRALIESELVGACSN
jgi:hypothetical protein